MTDPISHLDFTTPNVTPGGVSICPYCRQPLEHHQNRRVDTVQGEYHQYEADVVEHVFMCVPCWKRWPGKERTE